MVTTVNSSMLDTKVVTDVGLTGDILTFTYTDGTTSQLNIAQIPALAQLAVLNGQLAAINAYIASHP